MAIRNAFLHVLPDINEITMDKYCPQVMRVSSYGRQNTTESLVAYRMQLAKSYFSGKLFYRFPNKPTINQHGSYLYYKMRDEYCDN